MKDKAVPVQQPPSHPQGAVWPERTGEERILLVDNAAIPEAEGSALGAKGFQLFEFSATSARPVDLGNGAVSRTPPITARLHELAPPTERAPPPEEAGQGPGGEEGRGSEAVPGSNASLGASRPETDRLEGQGTAVSRICNFGGGSGDYSHQNSSY